MRSLCLSFCECYVYAATVSVEIYVTFFECEDCVIFADAYVFTWVPFGSALADDDVARDDDFATKFFNAEALAT